MRIVPMKTLLKDAYKRHYAVPAFNICNMENIQCVLSVANELRSPVILQAHYLEVDYAGAKNLADMTRNIGADFDLDIAIHLDHGATYEHAIRCIQGGFSSVMYDGSALPLDDNIAELRRVVLAGRAVGVTVEGEIGTVGQTTEFGDKIENAHLTDPASAGRLVKESEVDCLAVAIGNAHGFYTTDPKLDFDRLKEIARRVSIPLVLHGGTGIPKDQIQQAIKMGIAKINFSTALRGAFISAMKAFLEANPDELGLMDILTAGSQQMKSAIRNSIDMCMSAGKQ